jgi:hypothetical protein
MKLWITIDKKIETPRNQAKEAWYRWYHGIDENDKISDALLIHFGDLKLDKKVCFYQHVLHSSTQRSILTNTQAYNDPSYYKISQNKNNAKISKNNILHFLIGLT